MKRLILPLIILFAFKAFGQQTYTVCKGDTLILEVTLPLNVTPQWQHFSGSTFVDIPGAVSASITIPGVTGSTSYRARLAGPECYPYYSEIKQVIVNQLPVVFFTGLDSSYCVSDGPVTLVGNPSGGTFSGVGVTGNIFNPSAAGPGYPSITYSYTDAFNCKNATTSNTVVEAPPTTANAGPDITATAVTVQLAANTPVTGYGLWSIASGSGGSFASATNPTTNFTGNANNVYALVWTISNYSCDPSSDTVIVTMPAGPTLPSVICGSPTTYTMYVSPVDHAGPMLWGCVGITSGANDTWNGAANTALIVQMCGQVTAANVCDTLTAYGYSDWYLPSYNELECVRTNSVTIGGFAADKYWSSSEGAGILYLNAYYRTFPSGTSGVGSKASALARVRCVRKD
jgi:hypothetical protein